MGSRKERITWRNLWTTKNRTDVASAWRRTRFKVKGLSILNWEGLEPSTVFIIHNLRVAVLHKKVQELRNEKLSILKMAEIEKMNWEEQKQQLLIQLRQVLWFSALFKPWTMTHTLWVIIDVKFISNSAWGYIFTKWSNESKWNFIGTEWPTWRRPSANWNRF